jgi:transposase-like protein
MDHSVDVTGWWIREVIGQADRLILVVQRDGPYAVRAKDAASAAVAARIAADKAVRQASRRRKAATRSARDLLEASLKEARKFRRIAAKSVDVARKELRVAKAASIQKADGKRVREKIAVLEREEAILARWKAAPRIAAEICKASIAEAEQEEAAANKEARASVREAEAAAARALEKCRKIEGLDDAADHTCPKCRSQSVRDGFRPADYCGLPASDPRRRDADPPVTIPVTVRAMRQRYKCRRCRHPFLEEVPDIDEDHSITAVALDHIMTMLLRQASNRKIALELGIDDTTVGGIVNARFPELARLKKIIPRPIMLRISTVILEGKPRTILVDAGNLVVMDVLPDAGVGSLSKKLQRLTRRDRISIIAMDLDPRHKKVVRSIFGPVASTIADESRFVERAEQVLKTFRRAASVVEGAQKSEGTASRVAAAEMAVKRFIEIYERTTVISANAALNRWLSGLSLQTRSDLQPLVDAIHAFMGEMMRSFRTSVPRQNLLYLHEALKGVERRFRDEPFDFARQRLRDQEAELSAPNGFDRCHSCRNEFGRRETSATFSVPNELMSRARPYMVRMCEPCRIKSLERLRSWPARWAGIVAERG